MPHHGLLASQASRLEALKSRHAALTHHIEKEQQHLSVSDLDLVRSKKERLRMKDQMVEIEGVANG